MPASLKSRGLAVPKNSCNSESLEVFARLVEDQIKAKAGPLATVRLVARLMTSRDERIAALMTCKWIEWRYGKPKENGESIKNFAIQIINHVPRPGESAPIATDSATESGETSETKIIQAEPKSKQ